MEEWVAAIDGYLSLAERGVMVLAQGARDDLLPNLVAGLLPRHPSLAICLDPAELDDLPFGAVVVYRPEPAHARALNLGRPRIGDLALKVVLWSEAETTEALRREAPDFFDWISHLVECPTGVPHAVLERLRACARSRVHVVWRGPYELREALAAAGYEEVPRVSIDDEAPHEPRSAVWWELVDVSSALTEMTAEGWAMLEAFAWSRGALWVTSVERAPAHWKRIEASVTPLPELLREAAARGVRDRCVAVLAAASGRVLEDMTSGTTASERFVSKNLDARSMLLRMWDMRWAEGARVRIGPALLWLDAGDARWLAPMLLAFDALDQEDLPEASERAQLAGEYARRAFELVEGNTMLVHVGFIQLVAGVVSARLGRHADAIVSLDAAIKALRESFGEGAPTLHARIERALVPTDPRLVEAAEALSRMAAMRPKDDPDLRGWRRRLEYLTRRKALTAPAA